MTTANFSEDFCPNIFAKNSIQEKLATILLLLATLTSSLYLLRWSLTRIKKHFMVSLQLSPEVERRRGRDTSNETMYGAFLQWVAKNPNCAELQSHILLTRQVPLPENPAEPGFNTDFDSDAHIDFQTSSNNWRYRFATTVGLDSPSSFLYKNVRIEITRQFQSFNNELVILSTFSWNRALLLEIIQECRPLPKKDDTSKQIIYQ
ncbi:hypothetical protein Fcan01_15965 [Folsomia candida]|uniref:BCS1 N-terminal domain-containing protein n=1 Tax=Folsomia candida TaxID=158441 RepID=A0A226DXC7_FOLCA|nr:hypothetical protein Fcan01_15965 [Folsomia candida]